MSADGLAEALRRAMEETVIKYPQDEAARPLPPPPAMTTGPGLQGAHRVPPRPEAHREHFVMHWRPMRCQWPSAVV